MPRTRRSSQIATTSRSRPNQSLSQPTIEQSFSRSQSQKVIENLDELVNNCVRFIIYRAGSKLPIRKADIQKHVLKNVGRNFDRILEEVVKTLKDMYGYDLYLSEDGSSSSNKQYLVGNCLRHKKDPTENVQIESEDEQHPDIHRILILLVLTHVFMSNNSVSEVSLFGFLRSVEIDPDDRHELFGNVKDFILVTMVKQKYLSTEIEQITRKVSYSWGPRAEHEISKHEILKFVCKIYKDRNPQSWTMQYENANAQSKEDEVVVLQNGTHEVEEMSD